MKPGGAEAVTAAVLAGGRAQRLGGIDKGLALWRGRPLIAHVAAALAGQVDEILIVANRNADEYRRYGRVCADDRAGYRGPLQGIVTALRRARSDWLLVVPVDSPEPGTDLLTRLWRERGAAGVVVAHDGRRRQPLFALYRRAALAMPGDAPDMPVWAWQDCQALREVDFSDSPARFANLNTAEDFQ
ncbi:molybdenum cofactor guanylyltransferase MobA [Tahibacter caeni]|uniref:molybdenum cofactor guanylyltransferase MobA n=1 Tax=Tahibacter caeni TaxID=1453545 RepID=UPI00214959BD